MSREPSPPEPIPPEVARRRDLLMTAVMVGIALTPAWLTPAWFARPWALAVLALGLPALLWSWWHGPFVPTPHAELPRILRMLALQPGERFVDLGAGDGRVLLAVQRATGATGVGIENSPLLAGIGWLRLAPRGGSSMRWGDLYAADLSSFDVVYVWGTTYSVGTERFAAFLRRSLRPGARVISYHTPIPGWDPEAVDEGGQRPIFRYRV